MSADDVRRVAAHLAECQPCLAEHDLDVALKQVVRRSCSGETAPAGRAPADHAAHHHGAPRERGLNRPGRACATDENTRYAVRRYRVFVVRRSGVGLAAVVGLVALARAALAGALAHGVPFVGDGARTAVLRRTEARNDCRTPGRMGDSRCRATAVLGPGTASERNLPCSRSALSSPSAALAAVAAARPLPPPRPPPPTTKAAVIVEAQHAWRLERVTRVTDDD